MLRMRLATYEHLPFCFFALDMIDAISVCFPVTWRHICLRSCSQPLSKCPDGASKRRSLCRDCAGEWHRALCRHPPAELTPLTSFPPAAVFSPSRFESTPPHTDRWDMALFAGGPVWAMQWCPTPDGSPEKQYVALACHRGMDDEHCVNETYGGAALVQLWDVGRLDSCSRCCSSGNLRGAC